MAEAFAYFRLQERTCYLFAVFILMLEATVIGNDDGVTDDWTTGCPRLHCRCRWTSGKRTALCQQSQLTSLPEFRQPEKIQELHLEHNDIHILPEKVFRMHGLINLQKIYLQHSNLSKIHSTAFEGLTLLIELNLSHNRLTKLLPRTFWDNFRLRKLWLSYNPIRSLKGYNFPQIPHLQMLDISHCKLSKLQRNLFVALPQLEILKLNDNKFQLLDKNVFIPIPSLISLTLERNPWQCDCRLKDFWQWLMSRKLFNLPTACAHPKRLMGMTWDKLNNSALACSPKVLILKPMVSVSNNGVAKLSCLAKGSAHLSWVRMGIVVSNNSRALITSEDIHKTEFTKKSDQRQVWFNLTIKDMHPAGSGIYTCVAQNPGGISEGNVTVVYSESVATYMERTDMSALLVIGFVIGILFFFLITIAFVYAVFWYRKRSVAQSMQSSVFNRAERQSTTFLNPEMKVVHLSVVKGKSIAVPMNKDFNNKQKQEPKSNNATIRVQESPKQSLPHDPNTFETVTSTVSKNSGNLAVSQIKKLPHHQESSHGSRIENIKNHERRLLPNDCSSLNQSSIIQGIHSYEEWDFLDSSNQLNFQDKNCSFPLQDTIGGHDQMSSRAAQKHFQMLQTFDSDQVDPIHSSVSLRSTGQGYPNNPYVFTASALKPRQRPCVNDMGSKSRTHNELSETQRLFEALARDKNDTVV